MNTRHGRNTQVEFATIVAQVDFTVLRDTAFGNVHIGHNFNTRDHRSLDVLRRTHYIMQYTVYTIAHFYVAGFRLNVNVGSFIVNSLRNDQVYNADNRRLVNHFFELVNINLVLFDIVFNFHSIAEIGINQIFDGVIYSHHISSAEHGANSFFNSIFGSNYRFNIKAGN